MTQALVLEVWVTRFQLWGLERAGPINSSGKGRPASQSWVAARCKGLFLRSRLGFWKEEVHGWARSKEELPGGKATQQTD